MRTQTHTSFVETFPSGLGSEILLTSCLCFLLHVTVWIKLFTVDWFYFSISEWRKSALVCSLHLVQLYVFYKPFNVFIPLSLLSPFLFSFVLFSSVKLFSAPVRPGENSFLLSLFLTPSCITLLYWSLRSINLHLCVYVCVLYSSDW